MVSGLLDSEPMPVLTADCVKAGRAQTPLCGSSVAMVGPATPTTQRCRQLPVHARAKDGPTGGGAHAHQASQPLLAPLLGPSMHRHPPAAVGAR
mmetsp:Transcript_19457/g.34521  ORF Transcript_19457/g.34521 Transcript_19457/m.34521 type:complete len:94 (+) Transcript_19457:1441-1722(+)